MRQTAGNCPDEVGLGHDPRDHDDIRRDRGALPAELDVRECAIELRAGDPRAAFGIAGDADLPDAVTLQETMTLTDPKFYTKPWVSAKLQTFNLQLPKGVTELNEAYCVPSEEQEFNNNTRNPAGGISQTHEVR